MQWRNLWVMVGRGSTPPWKIIAMLLGMCAILCVTARVALAANGAFQNSSLTVGEPYVP